MTLSNTKLGSEYGIEVVKEGTDHWEPATKIGEGPETYEEAVQNALPSRLGIDFGPDFDYNDLSEEQLEAFFLSGFHGMGEKPN